MQDVFLMSPPRTDWRIRGGTNYLSSAGRPIRPGDALADWQRLFAAIRSAGGKVVVLPSAGEELTGLPYTAEAGMPFRDEKGRPSFLLSRMKHPHRRPEREVIRKFVEESLGWKTHSFNGIWEGQGDALRLDRERIIHTAGIGPASRTSPCAYSEVAPLLSARHCLIQFRADLWFHGNTFLGIFRGPSGPAILFCPDALLPGEEDRLREFVGRNTPLHSISRGASLAYATNALQVGRTVLAPPGLPASLSQIWKGLGLTVREIPLPTLFSRGGGAGVCLTLRLDL